MEILMKSTKYDYYGFLDRIIKDGIEACKNDYKDTSSKLEGAIAGFEACSSKLPEVLKELLRVAREDAKESMLRHYGGDEDLEGKDYWYWRCREAEIEWVCNVVSAMLINELNTPIIMPTARGAIKAAEILGINAL